MGESETLLFSTGKAPGGWVDEESEGQEVRRGVETLVRPRWVAGEGEAEEQRRLRVAERE